MPFHPNPVSMAVHVEHHRQELLDLAHQERLAKEAINGAPRARRGWSGMNAMLAGLMRAVAAHWRPELPEPLELPLELPQSTSGEATWLGSAR